VEERGAMKLVVRTPPIWFYSLKYVEQEFCELRLEGVLTADCDDGAPGIVDA
jgi:hypothetical protein